MNNPMWEPGGKECQEKNKIEIGVSAPLPTQFPTIVVWKWSLKFDYFQPIFPESCPETSETEVVHIL